jgi:hypothetical protein
MQDSTFNAQDSRIAQSEPFESLMLNVFRSKALINRPRRG